jgi:uncharacterized protein (UPF0276 family)
MFLAINYSLEAADLVRSGKIAIDYFKTPDWGWMVDDAETLRPAAVHFDLEAGNGELDDVDWVEVDRLAQITHTPYINLHLDCKQKRFPHMDIETTSNTDRRKVFDQLLSDIMSVVKRYDPGRVILENSPYRGGLGKLLRPSVEPDIIARLVEETGCGFLLDISHAVITARYFSMDAQEYLSCLPTQMVKELHFAGMHKIKGEWIDHLSIRKRDWRWLEYVLDQVQAGVYGRPWLLAFEYGGVGSVFAWRSYSQVIQEQVPMLTQRVTEFNKRLV